MMKKLLTTILAFMLIFHIVSIYVFAQPPIAVERTQEVREMLQQFDSQNIDSEILSKLNIGETEQVIKIFGSPPVMAFSRFLYEQDLGPLEDGEFNIELFFRDRNPRGYRFLVLNNAHEVIGNYWIDSNGNLRESEEWELGFANLGSGIVADYLSGNALQKVSQGIVIENIFIFRGDMELDSGAYYITNMGDFIQIGSELIFPIDDFMIYADDVWENHDQSLDGVYLDIWDLSQYNIHSPNFNPFAGVTSEIRNVRNDDESSSNTTILGIPPLILTGIVGVLVVVLILGFVWWKKRRNYSGLPE